MTSLHYTLTLSCSFFLPDLSQLQLPGSHSVQEGGEFEDRKPHWLHEFASVLVHSKEGAPPPLGQEWKCFLASNHVAYLEGILSKFGNALSKTTQQPAQHDRVSWCAMIWVGETEQSSGILRAHPAPDHAQKPDLFLTQNFVPLSLLGHLAFKLLPHLISKLVAEVFVHLGGVILCPSNKSGLVSIGTKELCWGRLKECCQT